jgi:phage-related tail fiber protein
VNWPGFYDLKLFLKFFSCIFNERDIGLCRNQDQQTSERQKMNINFNTNDIGHAEVRGLMALLSALFPNTNIHITGVNAALAQSPIPTTEEQAIAGVPIETAQAAAASQPEPPAPQSEQPTVTRHRRTKAQIAADAANAADGGTSTDPTPAGSSGLAAGSDAPYVVASGTAQAATAATSTAPASALKPISAEELRSLLNAFISKHSMEEAIEKLRSFGCNRVTEALALEPAKLNELAAVLNG